MSQTAYSNLMTNARAGMLADSIPADRVSKVAEGAVKVGLLATLGTIAPAFPTPGGVKAISDPVVSATAILASGGTTAVTPTTFSGAALNGATGVNRMSPARRITLVLSNSANWTAGSTIKVTGVDQDGYVVTELLFPPAGGNVTLTTDGYFGRVTLISVSATGGVAATFTAGFTAGDGLFGDGDSLVPFYDPTREPLTSGAAPNFDQYSDKDPCPCLRRGGIWVQSETSVNEGDPVFVRMTTSGANVPGQFANLPGVGFSSFPKGVWRTKLAAAGLAIMELR